MQPDTEPVLSDGSGDDDDELMHYVCSIHDGPISYCGTSVTRAVAEEDEDAELLCVVCAYLSNNPVWDPECCR